MRDNDWLAARGWRAGKLRASDTKRRVKGVPLEIIEAAVTHYRREHAPRLSQLLGWYKEQHSLADAIGHASVAHDPREQRHPHQRRLKKKALEEAGRSLLDMSGALRDSNTFDQLLTRVEDVSKRIPGLGELYAYDTALRIGAWLGVYPQDVYLHAGTRNGAMALGVDPKLRSVPLTLLPEAFQQLAPHEAEDALCIYKSLLAKA